MTRAIRRAPWQRPKPVPRRQEIDAKLRQQVRERALGGCELCAQPLGRVFQCHHRKLRSRGGQDSVANLVALHARCHNRVHGHPAWASEHGWIVAAGEDPATVPVALHGAGVAAADGDRRLSGRGHRQTGARVTLTSQSGAAGVKATTDMAKHGHDRVPMRVAAAASAALLAAVGGLVFLLVGSPAPRVVHVGPVCDRVTVGLLAADVRVQSAALTLALNGQQTRAVGLLARRYQALPQRPCEAS